MVAVVEDRRVSQCGIFGWRPSFLSVFNTPIMYLLLFSLSSFAISTTLGMNQVLMPTLQQLFNMNSKQMALILISNDLSGLVVAFIFGYFASKNKVRWLFFGVAINLIAMIMQSATQLFVTLPEPGNATKNGTKQELLCTEADSGDSGILPVVSDEAFYAVKNNKLFWVLFMAGILQGIGTPQQVCGVTYMDEVFTKKRLGPAIAFSNIITLMGFSLSFVFGAYLLTQYVTLGSPPEGVTPGSGHWVGAWWMGYLAPAILLLVAGVPMALFPTQMPAAKAVLQEKIDNGEATETEKEAELNRPIGELMKDMLPTVKRLLINKPLLFLLAGEALNNVFLSSLPYDTKLISMLYRMTPAETGTLLGILRAISTVIGLVLGGFYMAKFNPTGKKCVLFVAITQLLTIPGAMLTLWHCDQSTIAGVSIPYPTSISGLAVAAPHSDLPFTQNLTNECNGMCGCSTDFYEPVCDPQSKITYFSPCHAGCTSSATLEGGDKIYQNCACNGADLQTGPCPEEANCNLKKWIVLALQSVLGLIIYISQFPALNVAYLRVVPEIDRSATQGMKQFFTRAFGFLLGPIIFGAIIDNYCLVWREGGGSCWIYDLHSLIVTFNTSQLGFRLLGTLCIFIAWRLFPKKVQNSYTQIGDTKL